MIWNWNPKTLGPFDISFETCIEHLTACHEKVKAKQASLCLPDSFCIRGPRKDDTDSRKRIALELGTPYKQKKLLRINSQAAIGFASVSWETTFIIWILLHF